MSHCTEVMEVVTAENFFPQGYLLANLDVRKAFGATDRAARRHYRSYGLREHRMQVSRRFLDILKDPRYRQERFERFKHCFETLPDGANAVPLQYGSTVEDLAAYQSESSNPTAPDFFQELSGNPTRIYADIGAGLRNVVFDNCIYVEVYPSLTTDVVVQAGSALPFRTASLDGIGCFAVLEHVREPWAMAREIARVVKPGGKIFIDWPFLQPVHGYPSHYYNATPEGLRALFEPSFSIASLHTGAHEGPDFTIHWIVNGLLHAITDPAVRDAFRSKTVGELVNEPLQGEFWQRILKAAGPRAIASFSCGNTLIGIRKSAD